LSSTSHLDKLLDATVEIRQNPDAVERSYMARQLVQCTLPHSDPGNTPIWTRTNGKLTLAIRPNFDTKTKKALYPYGTIPRLLLFWLVTEATQKKSRKIELGNSLDAFMRAIGLNPRTGGGKRGDAARLQPHRSARRSHPSHYAHSGTRLRLRTVGHGNLRWFQKNRTKPSVLNEPTEVYLAQPPSNPPPTVSS
jgi:hypothetical protein